MRKMKYLCASFLFFSIVYISFPLYSYSSLENYSKRSNVGELIFKTVSRILLQKQMGSSDLKPKNSLQRELKLLFDGVRHSLLVGLMQDMTYVRCTEDLLFVLQNLGTSDGWASRMLDSYGKPESGILKGNLKWLGDYDQCTNIHAPYGDEDSHQGNFYGQYCSLTLTVNSGNMGVPVRLGICLPDSCHYPALKLEETIKKKKKSLPAQYYEKRPVFKDISIVCQPISRELSTEAFLVICLIFIFVALSIVGSLITLLEYFVKPSIKSHGSDSDIETEVPLVKEDFQRLPLQHDCEDFPPIANGYRNGNSQDPLEQCKSFFNVFCVFTNGSKLMDTSCSENRFPCLHGIRFLSLCWIFYFYTYSLSINAIRNVSDVLDQFENWSSQIVLNGIFSLDSFFLLSGFLVANVFFNHSCKTKGEINWIHVYIRRYLRFTPVYMMILVIYATLYSSLGSGPNWVNYNTDPACGRNWWWNLLYINNFQQSTDQCIGWSWYLASDLQFFLISPLILVPLLKQPKVGYSILASFFFVTIVSNIMLTYHFNLIAGFEKPISFDDWQVFDVKSMETMDYIYKKPYTRISPYLVGIMLAYYLQRRKQSGCVKNSFVTLILGWTISSVVSLLCVFGLYNHKLSLAGSCLYNAFSQTGFALSVAWVIYVCVTGQGGFVNKFLSWKIFIPLSRLNFCVYLVHPIILSAYYGSQKSLMHFSNFTMITLFLGFLIISYCAALVTSLLFESPIIRIEKYLERKHRKDQQY